MALKIGLVGPPNSGKSYSRRNLDGEEVFILMPSDKLAHLTLKGEKPLQRANYSTKAHKDSKEVLKALNAVYQNKYKMRSYMIPYYEEQFRSTRKDFEGLSIEGDYEIIKHLQYLESYLWFISDNMEEKKIVILPDFSHFISSIISKRSFIDRKAGGEAFQRFWELAGDTLNAFFESVDEMRNDLIVVTEFHSQYDEHAEEYQLFVPAGKMLEEKFKAESYFDDMYYTAAIKDEEGAVKEWVFYINKFGEYNARNGWDGTEKYVPNDLKPIIKKLRAKKGI